MLPSRFLHSLLMSRSRAFVARAASAEADSAAFADLVPDGPGEAGLGARDQA